MRAAAIIAFGLATDGSAANAATRSSMPKATTPHPAAPREMVLHRFLGQPDGELPAAGLIADSTGVLFGTTVFGGAYNQGALSELVPTGSDYTESVIYSFEGGKEGANPAGSLVADSAGTLYGTDVGRRQSRVRLGKPRGMRHVFALTRSGSSYTKRMLYAFKGYPTDGAFPGTLIADASGALYGTTTFGGNSRKCSSEGPGCGTAFRLSPSGSRYNETVLYDFGKRNGGLYPPRMRPRVRNGVRAEAVRVGLRREHSVRLSRRQ